MSALLSAEELARSALGEAMRRALVLQGVPAGDAHPLLIEATRVVDDFFSVVAAPPIVDLLCERLHPRGALPRATLAAALGTVLPVLAIVRA